MVSEVKRKIKSQPKIIKVKREQAIEFLKNPELNPITRRKILKGGRVYTLWMKNVKKLYPDLITKNENESKESKESMICKSEDILHPKDLISLLSVKNILLKTSKRYVYIGQDELEGYVFQGPYTSKHVKKLNDLMFIQECCYQFELPILSCDIVSDPKHHYWIRFSNHFHGTMIDIHEFSSSEMFETVLFQEHWYYYLLFLYIFGFDGLEKIVWIENERRCCISSFDTWIDAKERLEFRNVWDIFSKAPNKKVMTWYKESIHHHRNDILTFLNEIISNQSLYQPLLEKYSKSQNEIEKRIQHVKIIIEWF